MAPTNIRRNRSLHELQGQLTTLQAELERSRRVLELVYNISLACRGVSSFQDIFEVTYRELRAVFALDACYIALSDARCPDLFRAVYTVDEGTATYAEEVEVGTLTGTLMQQRRPLLFRDLVEERKALGRDPEPFGDERKRSRSWLGVPLLVGQDAVGVISIQSYQVGVYDDVDRDLLQRLGNIVAVALENASLAQNQRKLSAALAEQVSARTVELVTLNAIAAELVLQSPLPVLLDRALDLIVPLFGLEGGSVRILDTQRDELVLAAQRGFPDPYRQAAARLAVADSPLGRIVRENQPLVVPSGLREQAWYTIAPPFEALLGVPLSIGGRVLGALSLFGTQAQSFDQQQVGLAQAIGNQIAIAIENAHLFEEQERQIAELRALGDISHAATTAHDLPTLLRLVHDAIQPFTRLDAFSMVVFDPERKIITDDLAIDEGHVYACWRNQAPPPDSLTAWLIRNQRTLHFHDLASEIVQYPGLGLYFTGGGKHAVSWLGVPLTSRDGAVIGALSIQSYQPQAFDERDEAFLVNVARQVALHVQNVRLRTQRERQIRELDAIGRIGQLVSASYNLDEMLDVVYQTLDQVTNASVFYLLICDPEQHVITNAVFFEQGQRVELIWNSKTPAPGSLTAWILRHREPLLFRDIVDRDQLKPLGITPIPMGPENPVRSWAGVPLLAKDGEAIGVLSVQDYQPNQYDQQTLDFLNQVASHVSLGVQKVRLFGERERQLAENTRLFAEAQDHAAAAERQAQRMELVNRIALLLSSRLDQQEVLDLAAREVVRLFWADHTGILLFEEDESWGSVAAEYPLSGARDMRLPLVGNLIAEELIASHRPVCITSVETDPRAAVVRTSLAQLGIASMMVVPLVSRGRVIGSISLDSFHKPRIFTREEQDLFLTVAASIASALDNARLFAAEQAAHRTADTLREVARVLSSSFDPREVLQLILRELGNVIAYDTASIMLLDRDMLRIAAYSAWDENPNLRGVQLQLDQRTGAWLVVRRRKPVIISDTVMSPDWTPEPGDVHIRSWLGVPLIARGVLMGVLNIDSHQPNRFRSQDAEAARAFADQAAVALENARLYEESVTRVEQELEIARRIQSNLFPRRLPQLEGVALDARCLPARETGGDFYDFVMLDDEGHDGSASVAIMVGDASGKSIPGAMLMAVARSIARSEARDHRTPETVMRETNRWIAEDVPLRSFVALCYATLDPAARRLALANGGQLAPLRRRRDGTVEYLDVPGPTLPLGILPDTPYATLELVLEPGDLLVFYTDGIVEAQDSTRQLFGFERLEALIGTHGHLPPGALIDLILRTIGDFIGAMPQHDDMTIVALRVE